ncbi:MAG: RsmB/NOP family class I SAM-dependent RNA methyltransferase [Rhodobacteraceae bacterium]|nr:RsmB/NOP family class I SAM-dependent RNA methyltransferase [Paracoccaceae bacterium]
MTEHRRQEAVGGLKARRAALRAIGRVLRDGAPLTFPRKEAASLDHAELAMARRISAAVFRHFARAESVLDNCLRHKPPMSVGNILRLAVTEIHACGTKPHAAVDQAVRLVTGDGRIRSYSGMVNAVLRRASGEEGWRWWADAGPPRLPEWISRRLEEAYGPDVLRRIEAAHEVPPPLDLTSRAAVGLEGLARRLGAESLPTGSLRLHEWGQVSELHGFADGAWWVQDAAAAIPVRLLGRIEGLRVVDLCAAPGGKSMQCAAVGAEIVAVDKSAERLETMRENLARTSLEIRLVNADALSWQPDADIIVIDAPCSATGTIRRNPELPYRRRGKGWLRSLEEGQKRLLQHGLRQVKPGGRVLYCVCSLLPGEGEHVVQWAVRELGAGVVRRDLREIGADPGWETTEGGVRLRPDYWPEIGGMDGFYAAVLTPRGS